MDRDAFALTRIDASRQHCGSPDWAMVIQGVIAAMVKLKWAGFGELPGQLRHFSVCGVAPIDGWQNGQGEAKRKDAVAGAWP